MRVMPIYEYQCSQCGEKFEVRQSIGDDGALAKIYTVMNLKILKFPKPNTLDGIYLNLKTWNFNPTKKILNIVVPYENEYEQVRIRQLVESYDEKIDQNRMNLNLEVIQTINLRINYNLQNIENPRDISNYLTFFKIKNEVRNDFVLIERSDDIKEIRKTLWLLDELSNMNATLNLGRMNECIRWQERGNIVDMNIGRVHWFNPRMNYGFISINENEDEDIFVHISSIITHEDEFSTLSEENFVLFEIIETEKGPQAFNVIEERDPHF